MVLTILSAAFLSADPLSAPWRAEPFSVTAPAGVLSLDANPAGLAGMQDWELVVEASPDGPNRRSAAFLGLGNFAFGWASTPDAAMLRGTDLAIERQRARAWMLGLGVPLPGGVDIGAGARYRDVGELNTGWSWDLGAIWRPGRFLSLGWDWRDAGERDGTRWSGHGLGVALRPFGTPFATIGWECWKGGVPYMDAMQTDHDLSHELQAEIRPHDWLAVTGRWALLESDEVWSLALSAQLSPHARLFGRTQPGAEGGTLQGVGIHLGGDLLPDAGLAVPGAILYHVGSLSGEAGDEGLIRSRKGFAQVRDDLLRLARRYDVKAVVLDLGPGQMTLSHAGALRRLALLLRERGKTVSAWSQDLTMSSLHVMSACNRAAISPLGTVRAHGLSLRTIYAGEALKRHGIDVQVIRTGPWKSAMEPFVASRMSDEARGDLEAHLHDLDSMILGGVAQGRRLDPAKLLAWVDSGSMLPSRAVHAGILDTLVESSDLTRWGFGGLLPVAQPQARAVREAWGRPRQVAVLSLEGQIADGRGAPGMFPWGRNLDAEAVVAVLKNLKSDPRIGAVVLRVNSPGGSVVGSERIRRAVAALDARKPVVASFGGVAASGAYLFSLPARRIWTEPESIVGSIGVFTAKVSVGRLLDSLGLHVETVATGPQTGISSPLVPFDSLAASRVREQVEDAYAMFSNLVKDARHLDSAAFARVDGGRVFTGARAASNGLADELGGLDAAVAWAARAAGLPADAPQEWYVPGNGRWQAILSRLDAASTDPWNRWASLLSAPATATWAQLPWEIDGP